MRLTGLRLTTWLEAYAGAAAEAAIYQQLSSRLSNAELERRGISRGELHRILGGMNDQTGQG
jgi:hypothetical protein